MKAGSVIFTGTQRPMTIFGLSPGLFGLLGGAAGLAFGVCVVLHMLPIALVLSVTVFVIGWLVLWRRTRADCHFSNLLFMLPRFWAGKGGRRQLVTGTPVGRRGR
ncbi:hypothetical protein [Ferrovibrio sp.]|uniref:hypothetical protein n=1 Tax=Ferrovibrio sp. TaxID=1917215 RepID=UPI00311D6B2A